MNALSIKWGLVAILTLALLFLWRRADKRGKEIQRLKARNDILEKKLEARDEQLKIDRKVDAAGRNNDLDEQLRADRKKRPNAY